MSGKRDLNGQTFGRLTVIGQGGKTKSGNYKWRVLCACGTRKEVSSDHLVRPTQPVKSCGCLLAERNREPHDPDLTAFNLLLASYRKRARQKGRDFEIPSPEFRALTQGDCEYCGQPPRTVQYSRSKRGQYVHNGIDRVDPAVGYIAGNCVPCCKLCNYMKLALSKDAFIAHVLTIAAFQQGKAHG